MSACESAPALPDWLQPTETAELRRVLGKKTLENEIFVEEVAHDHWKKWISRFRCPGRPVQSYETVHHRHAVAFSDDSTL